YSEIGADLGRFRTEKHFTSWLGLCPDNRVSGGKPLETRTRKVASRAAYALRMAAYAAGRSHSAIGDFFRRKRAHLGASKAITATAHKLARIIYHLLTTRQPYDETRFAHHQQQDRTRRETRLPLADLPRGKAPPRGPSNAITAPAHNPARIIYHRRPPRHPYDEPRFAHHHQQHGPRRETRLRRQAQALGFMLVPCQDTSAT